MFTPRHLAGFNVVTLVQLYIDFFLQSSAYSLNLFAIILHFFVFF